MPKPHAIPQYRLQKARGVGVVRLSGKDFYLGTYGTPASLEQYRRVVAEWVANGRRLIETGQELTIIEVMAAFIEHARQYYRRPDGTPTSEFDNYCQALRPLKKLYGTTLAAQFGPKCLRTVQQEMMDLGWCRSNINKQINRIRSFFKWAVSQELLAASVYQGLQSLAPLKRGRCQATESEPVKPVPESHIEAVKPFVSRQVWALIQLQLLTGARAGELMLMRAVDIDTSSATWVYTPTQHKTAHHGHRRTIFFGPRAQAVIRPFLMSRPVDTCLFSAAEAEMERRERLHAQRVTPESCGNTIGSNRQPSPRRTPEPHYTVASYRRAIARACLRADRLAHQQQRMAANDEVIIRGWHPHQLRHNAATNVRRAHGIEVARIVLGHRSAVVTELYAERDNQQAEAIMQQIG